jgi:hypothetical protein
VEREVCLVVKQEFLWRWGFILVGLFCHVCPAFRNEANC